MASLNRNNPKAKKKQALGSLNSNKYKILTTAAASGGDVTSSSSHTDSLNSSSLLKSLDAIGNLPDELLALLVLSAIGMQILAHVTARQLGAAHAAEMQARSALAETFEN